MPEYLVEVYAPRSGEAAVRAAAARARESARQISAEGSAVRYVRAIFVPEDETCFHVFEASTTMAVRAACEDAALPASRIVRSLGLRPEIEVHSEGGCNERSLCRERRRADGDRRLGMYR